MRFFITLCLLGGLCYLWQPLFHRALWHDEEQIAFAAKEIMRTGQRAYFDGAAIVGENLHHPLNDNWDLEVMSPGEVWVAVFGKWSSSLFASSEDPWKLARWPFACAGLFVGVALFALVRHLTREPTMGFLAGLSWFVIPWTWTLSVQLRYYPICWLLIVVGLYGWVRSGASQVLRQSVLLFVLYLFNWILAPLLLALYVVMDCFRVKKERLPVASIFFCTFIPIGTHAFFFSSQASGVLAVPSRWPDAFKIFWLHLMEFNLDVFPLLLLVILSLAAWSDKKIRPWVAGGWVLVLLLLIPNLYTRLILMFLPLYVVLGVLAFNKFIVSKPFVSLAVFLLWAATHFFQSFPGIVGHACSQEMAQRFVMPLSREWGSVFENPKEAWGQVWNFDPSPVPQLKDYLQKHLKPEEQVICAMDGTALGRVTGLTINWKMPEWGRQRDLPQHLLSPEGVKAVVVRSQWPYLSREVTWTAEILKGIEEGWLVAKKDMLPLVDARFTGAYPFAFARHRQAWPWVDSLTVWLLDHPVTKEEADRLMNLKNLALIRPPGISPKSSPDVVWGHPIEEHSKKNR